MPRKSVWMDHWLAQPSWHLAVTLPPKARRRDVVLGLGGAVSPFPHLVCPPSAWKLARDGVARGSTGFASLGTRQDGQWQRVGGRESPRGAGSEGGLEVCLRGGGSRKLRSIILMEESCERKTDVQRLLDDNLEDRVLKLSCRCVGGEAGWESVQVAASKIATPSAVNFGVNAPGAAVLRAFLPATSRRQQTKHLFSQWKSNQKCINTIYNTVVITSSLLIRPSPGFPQ